MVVLVLVAGPGCRAMLEEAGAGDIAAPPPPSDPVFGPGSGPVRPDAGIAPAGPGAASYDPVLTAEAPPPPISGGTLRLQADGRTAVASDPDRDKVYLIDLVRQRLVATILLDPGDEPGRHVEDGAGRVHVVLRRGGAIATIDVRAGALAERRPVCPAPRGIAFDAGARLLHVACAGGELISLPANGGEPVRRLQLERDLRDVVVAGADRLYVSTFRKAEVLVLDAAGQVRERLQPPRARSLQKVRSPDGGAPAMTSPAVAWRMLPDTVAGGGGVVLLHQRGTEGEVPIEPGGYGGAGCGSIVEAVVTPMIPGGTPSVTPVLSGVTLGVDMALSADGTRVAVVAPGNARRPGGPQVNVYQMGATGEGCVGPLRPIIGPPPGESPVVDELPPPSVMRQPAAEATAIVMDRKGNVIVQTRQPATLEILTQAGAVVPLALESRADTGHAIFHSNPQSAVTCASCHPEGGEDGRVWTFAKVGARRTQSLRGGIMKTAPFHWNGEMRSLEHLMQEVFVGRMTGPRLQGPHLAALERWLDAVPAVRQAPPRDPAAVERGRALFHGAAVGCATCHAGPLYTNNTTVDVGTRGLFQVPPLVGLAARAPFMHDGCAVTLADRFTACGGDDRHGVVSRLGRAEIADLVAFLESL